jgi:hypothetical protein
MDYLEKSSTIKRAADAFLKQKQIIDILSQYGEVVFAGSYATGLMTWHDIDIQLVTKLVYMGIEFSLREISVEWKVDIWVLEDEDFQESRILHNLIVSNLTEELRMLILKLKFNLMGDGKRVPKLSSYYIYQAIFRENITEELAIIEYFRQKRI